MYGIAQGQVTVEPARVGTCLRNRVLPCRGHRRQTSATLAFPCHSHQRQRLSEATHRHIGRQSCSNSFGGCLRSPPH
eukprot:2766924-Amphidinium_carterae.1